MPRSVPNKLKEKQDKQRKDTIKKIEEAIEMLKDLGYHSITVSNLVTETGYARSTFSKPHVEEVLKNLGQTQAPQAQCTPKKECCKVTAENYPLGEKMSEKIKAQSGMALDDLTLDKVINGEIKSEDIRIAPETLEMQAQVAESVGRDAFASNLRRAAELIAVPDKRIL